MKKVLLINTGNLFNNTLVPPLGLEYIAEDLGRHNYRSEIIDLSIGEMGGLIKKIGHSHYLAIGISVRNISKFNFLPTIKNLVSQIKNASRMPIVLGGAGFSLAPKDILRYIGGDYGIAGVGVAIFPAFLKSILAGKVKPFTILKYAPSSYLNFSFRRNLLNLCHYQERGAKIGVSTKIGCPAACIYCAYPKIEGHTLKIRNFLRVVDEIKNLTRQGINQIFFTDSVFNRPIVHAQNILKEIVKRKLSINWTAHFYPSRKFFSNYLFELMRKSGLDIATLGADSCSDKILKILNKGFSINDLEDFIKLCKKNKINIMLELLFGAPGETKKTIDETFKFVDRLRLENLHIHVGIRIFKFTKIGEISVKQGIIKKTDNLLEPILYPFKLKNYVFWEAEKRRKNCQIFIE